MKNTIYGVVGYKGKLGSLLVEKPNFIPIDCDVTNINSIRKTYQEVDVLVNCSAMSSVDECEKFPRDAFRINVRGADNLMEVYGKRVLNISSDYVFSGWNFFPPTESTKPSPMNVYGMTKAVVEDLAINTYGAKVIRLSRTVDMRDADINGYFYRLLYSKYTQVPAFFHRNYLTRSQAVNGVEYFVRNFEKMPPLVNYGSKSSTPFYTLMVRLATHDKRSPHLLERRNEYNSKLTPRPKKAGFSVGLAKKLGFPIYDLDDVVQDFWK